MSQQLETIRFHNPHPGYTGVVDHQNAVIHGVSVITGNVIAEGHDLRCDKHLLTQLCTLGKSMGQCPVTIDHDGGAADVNGWLQNFRLDGDHVRADWVLLKTHKETPTCLERAERQPSTVGLSAAFKGDPAGTMVNGERCARAEKLLSVDLVKRAAANPAGLFSADGKKVTLDSLRADIIRLHRGEEIEGSVDTSKLNMLDPNLSTQAQAPTLESLAQQVAQLTTALQQQSEMTQQLVGHINGQTENQEQLSPQQQHELLSQLNAMSDEQLAAEGLTRAEVDQAVGEYNARAQAGEGEEGGETGTEGTEGQTGGESQTGGEQGGAAAMAGAGASAGGTAFNALQRQVIALQAEINAEKARKKSEAEAIQFAAVDSKMNTLAEQRDQAIQLAQKLVAENEALHLHVRTGTRPVKAGVDAGIRLFGANGAGELHQFQNNVKAIMADKKCTEGQAILFAMKAPDGPALHADWLQSQTIHA